ncbi:hypothetical protein QBC40DRAFT_17985 [Triangularia verruculosa]|uniref:UBZ4-type domain-containing protein n=1 Tax=Triangularia verruculosa TaxID=2587418 RepID=A0AAN6XBS5_9PEZI|nr:hypothetical protein QBC40DRAFT_17985 [Triangularia verruculosa]
MHRHQQSQRRVPSTREVVPGAPVNIVLKVDQPTGRTVSGLVKDVLTKGEHHRGIKVRLVDGRVGRVQSMGSSSTASTTDSGSGDFDDFASGSAEGSSALGFGGREREERSGRGRYQAGPTDWREEERPSEQVGLDAYIRPAKQKRGGRRGGPAGTTSAGNTEPTGELSAAGQEVSTCPVCNDFTGDATAIAHHVTGHFDN